MCALLRHLYQLDNSAINLILVPIAYLVLLALSRFLGMTPALNHLVRIGGDRSMAICLKLMGERKK